MRTRVTPIVRKESRKITRTHAIFLRSTRPLDPWRNFISSREGRDFDMFPLTRESEKRGAGVREKEEGARLLSLSLVLKGQYLTRRRRRRRRRWRVKGCQAGCRADVATTRNRVRRSSRNIPDEKCARRYVFFCRAPPRLPFGWRVYTWDLRSVGRLWMGGRTLGGAEGEGEKEVTFSPRSRSERTELRVQGPPRTRRIPGGQKRNCSPSRSRANLFDMPGKPDCECDFPRKADYGLSSFPAWRSR